MLYLIRRRSEMNKKLTLSVDDYVVSRAKKYAKEQKKSLSEIVENYLRMITTSYKNDKDRIDPLVLGLMGSINVSDNFDYKKEKYEYLNKKYVNG